jgi:hypothetical protein
MDNDGKYEDYEEKDGFDGHKCCVNSSLQTRLLRLCEEVLRRGNLGFNTGLLRALAKTGADKSLYGVAKLLIYDSIY